MSIGKALAVPWTILYTRKESKLIVKFELSNTHDNIR